jgi:biopolymer transport protein ExbB/TolQ
MLAVAFIAAVHAGLFHEPLLERYLGHLVERVELLLFASALGILCAKLLALIGEKRVLRAELLPKWNGTTVGVEEAPRLLEQLQRCPRRLHNTFLYQRLAAVLDFLSCRRCADDLDDQLRALADSDAMALDASYSLTRFITWAIPILGFLGTVLGITGAISGITPEILEKSLSGVTDGLALAFDATALALSLTMTTMYLTFQVERAEAGVLETVDRHVEHELAHRFIRTRGETPPTPPASSGVLQVEGFTALAQKFISEQATALAGVVAAVEARAIAALAPSQEKLTAALEAALERTLQAHAQRLTAVERGTIEHGVKLFQQMGQVAQAVRETGQENAAALKRLADAVAAQAQLLVQVQQGERQLLQLQTVMQQNLTALTGSGAFEKAVHSLTAAVHLLTARSAAAVPQAPMLRLVRPDTDSPAAEETA